MVAIKQLLVVNHEIQGTEGGGLSSNNPHNTSITSSRTFTSFDTGMYIYIYIYMHKTV
jgi:hypothetical protein